MASAVKIPIAINVLSRIDQGQLTLDQTIEIRQNDLSPGSGTIQTVLYEPGLTLSVQNLLELTLTISDNTASDVLLRLVDGPLATTQFLQTIGINGIRIDRLIKHLLVDKYGIAGLSSNDRWSLAHYQNQFEQLTPDDAQIAAARFVEDERDTMTPAAMVRLLTEVYTTGLLAPSSRDILLSMMQRCQTGEGALKGMLPPGVAVAHKTGTLTNVVAIDVGIITLPDDMGHIAIAVCVKSPEAKGEASSVCQQVIAHVARAVL